MNYNDNFFDNNSIAATIQPATASQLFFEQRKKKNNSSNSSSSNSNSKTNLFSCLLPKNIFFFCSSSDTSFASYTSFTSYTCAEADSMLDQVQDESEVPFVYSNNYGIDDPSIIKKPCVIKKQKSILCKSKYKSKSEAFDEDLTFSGLLLPNLFSRARARFCSSSSSLTTTALDLFGDNRVLRISDSDDTITTVTMDADSFDNNSLFDSDEDEKDEDDIDVDDDDLGVLPSVDCDSLVQDMTAIQESNKCNSNNNNNNTRQSVPSLLEMDISQ